jgi:hypothetical protein
VLDVVKSISAARNEIDAQEKLVTFRPFLKLEEIAKELEEAEPLSC